MYFSEIEICSKVQAPFSGGRWLHAGALPACCGQGCGQYGRADANPCRAACVTTQGHGQERRTAQGLARGSRSGMVAFLPQRTNIYICPCSSLRRKGCFSRPAELAAQGATTGFLLTGALEGVRLPSFSSVLQLSMVKYVFVMLVPVQPSSHGACKPERCALLEANGNGLKMDVHSVNCCEVGTYGKGSKPAGS